LGRATLTRRNDRNQKCDLVDEDEFVRKVRENLKVKNLIIEKVYGGQKLDEEQVISEYLEYGRKLKEYVADVTALYLRP